ncbi:hypothetical protein Q9189_006161 [Teloschistes chrysophthalmus]
MSPAGYGPMARTDRAPIPLYLAAGPSLDVWTSDRRTQQWLQAYLLHNSRDDGDKNGISWQESPGGQSEHGILLGVDNDQHDPIQAGLDITEILLYAASSETLHGHPLPLTPPHSSSPSHAHGTQRIKPSIKLYALPLSSNIFQTINESSIAQDTYSIASEDAYYLSFPSEPPLVQPENTKARKRAKIETLFNDASQNRRAQKKRGGEGVAKAMAGLDGRIPMPLPLPALPDTSQPTKKTAQKRGVLSRAFTTSSLPPTEEPISRPQGSRRPTLITTHHRSSLSHVENILSPSLTTTTTTQSPAPETPTNAIETLNKNALSRIIMAGMRMYGLQQPRRKSVATPLEAQAISANQEEYKAIYHQTFKAAAFAFRKSWREKVVGQEGLRDTVDLFLGRFCRGDAEAEAEAEAGLEDALNSEFGI